MGPYETVVDALTEPLYQEIRDLHASGRISHGDPDRLIATTALAHLEAACAEAGIELGAHDRQILAWLAGTEASTVQAVIGLITRANTTTST